MRGVVKWYNVTKGYGFIKPEDGSGDVFVHYTVLRKAQIRALDDNQAVTFEAEAGRDGKPRAAKVELVRA